MVEGEVDIEALLSLEQALHRPEVRRSREAVEALLADGFVEIGSSGRVYARAAMIEALTQENAGAHPGLPRVLDFTARALAPNAVLVTYRSISDDLSGAAERCVLRSSIWQRTGGNWQMLFHQGTVARPE